MVEILEEAFSLALVGDGVLVEELGHVPRPGWDLQVTRRDYRSGWRMGSHLGGDETAECGL